MWVAAMKKILALGPMALPIQLCVGLLFVIIRII